MKVLVPVTTSSSPSCRNSVVMPVASDPAVGSVIVSDASPPSTMTGSSLRICSAVPKSLSGFITLKVRAQMTPVDAHALDSSRTHARYAAYETGAPPNSSGTNIAFSPSSLSAWMLSRGNSPERSYSAARGAICSRARACTLSISMRSSGVNSIEASSRLKTFTWPLRSVCDSLSTIDVDGFTGEEWNVLRENRSNETRHLLGGPGLPARNALFDVFADRSRFECRAVEIGDDVTGCD